MKTNCTILATAFAAALSASAKTFDWPIDAPTAGARQFTAYHGETVRFNLQFKGAMTNLSPVAIYYQTNGMGRAEWFGPVPGTVFHPTNDCGAAFYRFFIRCADPDGVDYTANGSLRLLDSPGFDPSTIQLPVQTLDFSKIEVLNPPWGEGGGGSPPGNYEAVSNAAMNAVQPDELGKYALAGTVSRLAERVDDAEETANGAFDLATAKQDALPYPTNAIPYSAIEGTPSVDFSTNNVSLVATASDATSNTVTKAYVEGLGISSTPELYDPVRDRTWVSAVTNGVFFWYIKED